MSAPVVFYSHAWADKAAVEATRRALEARGFGSWIDTDCMHAGDSLFAEISRGIDNAAAVLAFISPAYLASENCNKELQLAASWKKVIIFVKLPGVDWPPRPKAGRFAADMAAHMAGALYEDGGGGGTEAEVAERLDIALGSKGVAAPAEKRSAIPSPTATRGGGGGGSDTGSGGGIGGGSGSTGSNPDVAGSIPGGKVGNGLGSPATRRADAHYSPSPMTQRAAADAIAALHGARSPADTASALGTILTMLREIEKHRGLILGGVCKPLVATLLAHGDDVSVCSIACRALQNICQECGSSERCEPGIAAAVEAGAPAVLAAVALRHSGSVVAAYASKAASLLRA